MEARTSWLVEDYIKLMILHDIKKLQVEHCLNYLHQKGEKATYEDVFQSFGWHLKDGKLTATAQVLCKDHPDQAIRKYPFRTMTEKENAYGVEISDEIGDFVSCPICKKQIEIKMDHIYLFFHPNAKYTEWIQKLNKLALLRNRMKR